MQLANAFFDALGDDDLAFAGEQFDGAHLAHVHAHRVGGAAGFVSRRRPGRRRLRPRRYRLPSDRPQTSAVVGIGACSNT